MNLKIKLTPGFMLTVSLGYIPFNIVKQVYWYISQVSVYMALVLLVDHIRAFVSMAAMLSIRPRFRAHNVVPTRHGNST